jgi:hypothetical protein
MVHSVTLFATLSDFGFWILDFGLVSSVFRFLFPAPLFSGSVDIWYANLMNLDTRIDQSFL